MQIQTVNPAQWITQRIGAMAPVRPPVIYVAHPVAAQPGEVLARCTECGCCYTFAPGDAVDLRLVCAHDAPVKSSTDAAAIVAFNLARAMRWWQFFHLGLVDATWTMPWYVNVTANGEQQPELVKRGLRDDCELVKRSDAVMLCGPLVRKGGGMELEARTALEHGVDVFQVDGIHCEPPRIYPAAQVPWRRWQS